MKALQGQVFVSIDEEFDFDSLYQSVLEEEPVSPDEDDDLSLEQVLTEFDQFVAERPYLSE